jgi:hypothetical protein
MTAKPIYELCRNQCKFSITPDGAKLHLFCAEPTEEDGAVYCDEHAARCYDRRSLTERKMHHERAAKARAALCLANPRPRY